MERPTVCLVANPHSSKDVRRLTTLARVVDVEEKANILARFLVGIRTRVATVHGLDDTGGILRRAGLLAGDAAPTIEYLPIKPAADESDTRRAAEWARREAASLMVLLGGDGTIRAAAEGWPRMPLLALPAGTNNAFIAPVEATIAGVAAGRHVTDSDPDDFDDLVVLTVESGTTRSTAVVDAVAVSHRWTGARAVSDPTVLIEAVIANVDNQTVGIGSVAAALGPIPPRHARHIRFGPGTPVEAVIGPGIIRTLDVAEHHVIPVGAAIQLDPAISVVALDGERHAFGGGPRIRVEPGPRRLDVSRVLARTRNRSIH